MAIPIPLCPKVGMAIPILIPDPSRPNFVGILSLLRYLAQSWCQVFYLCVCSIKCTCFTVKWLFPLSTLQYPFLKPCCQKTICLIGLRIYTDLNSSLIIYSLPLLRLHKYFYPRVIIKHSKTVYKHTHTRVNYIHTKEFV